MKHQKPWKEGRALWLMFFAPYLAAMFVVGNIAFSFLPEAHQAQSAIIWIVFGVAAMLWVHFTE
jgi:hypothetical protein